MIFKGYRGVIKSFWVCLVLDGGAMGLICCVFLEGLIRVVGFCIEGLQGLRHYRESEASGIYRGAQGVGLG